MTTPRLKWLFLISTAALAFSCGSDAENNDETTCAAGLTFDPIRKECVRLSEGPVDEGPVDETDDAGELSDAGADAPDDAGMDAATEPDGGAPDLGCQTDEDSDGAIAMSCGGDDCNDQDPRVRPDAIELCDEVDNDCDVEVNEELDCSFYAHSLTRLYRLDVFAGTADDLGQVPDLNDIDTAPDGTLYGISFDYLYSYDAASGQWTQAAQPLALNAAANGFCIDNDGTAYITTFTNLRVVDLQTGVSTSRGSMAPASSSGDCVVNKGNVLFMTSSHTTPDSFVKLDGSNGRSTQVGQTGYDSIWGLTAAWGGIYGTTDAGDVVSIDESTGQTMLVHKFPNLSFYGAASTPAR